MNKRQRLVVIFAMMVVLVALTAFNLGLAVARYWGLH